MSRRDISHLAKCPAALMEIGLKKEDIPAFVSGNIHRVLKICIGYKKSRLLKKPVFFPQRTIRTDLDTSFVIFLNLQFTINYALSFQGFMPL